MPRDMKTSRFLLRGFRRPREIACFALGKLERQVMEETWRLGEVSVRDIHRVFEERIAYTTLMTTLDRLFKKKLLERRKDGRAFVYARWSLATNSIAVSRKTSSMACSVTELTELSRCSPASSTLSAKEIANSSTSSIVWCRKRNASCSQKT